MRASNFRQFSDIDVSQGSAATPLRCGGIINDSSIAHSVMNPLWINFENRSIFGEVMDNIVVDCFFLTLYNYTVSHKKERTYFLCNFVKNQRILMRF